MTAADIHKIPNTLPLLVQRFLIRITGHNNVKDMKVQPFKQIH